MKKYLVLLMIVQLFAIAELQSQNLLPVGTGIPAASGIYGGTVTYNNEIYAANFYHIYKWNSTSWIDIGITVDYAIECMEVYNGELYVAGWFEHFNGIPVNRIIRYNGSTWQSVGTGVLVCCGATGGVEKMTVYDNKLIAIGGFIQAGSVSAKEIASWDGMVWDSLGSGLSGVASAPVMVVFNGGLFVFSQIDTAGGIPVHNLAMWDGGNWNAVGNGFNYWAMSAIVFNNNIYVGLRVLQGNLTSIIVKWDGNNWTNVEQNISSSSWKMVLALKEFNGCLYAAGRIDTINGVSVADIARYDGSNWYPVGNGISGYGNFFTELNNELYLTGDFIYSGPTTVNWVVKFDTPPICITTVDEIDNQVECLISPNPFSSSATISFNYASTSSATKHTVIITDILGKEIKTINFSGKECMIEKGDMERGIYFVQVMGDGSTSSPTNTVNKKIVVQ